MEKSELLTRNKIKFSVLDVDFSLSFAFLSVLTLMFIFDVTGRSLQTILAYIAHELSHIGAIILFGGKIKSMDFSICEMNIKTEKELLSKFERIIVEASGAFANFFLAFIFIETAQIFAYTNIIIASFQLLPVVSFDGENILELMGVSLRTRRILSFFVTFMVALLGFYVLLITKYNFSILILSLYLMFTCFTCNKA